MSRFTINDLAATIDARAASGGEASYTRKLLDKGAEHCAKKLGEEAVETVEEGAAIGEGPAERQDTGNGVDEAGGLQELFVLDLATAAVRRIITRPGRRVTSGTVCRPPFSGPASVRARDDLEQVTIGIPLISLGWPGALSCCACDSSFEEIGPR